MTPVATQSPRIDFGINDKFWQGYTDAVIDPVHRLLDPQFTEKLWEYEHSRTDAMLPGKLHPKQEAALSADSKHRWLFWGNQVGKTTVGAVDCVLLALGRHPYLQKWQPPVTGWASALSWELWEKVLLPELLTWIPRGAARQDPRAPLLAHRRRRHPARRVADRATAVALSGLVVTRPAAGRSRLGTGLGSS